MEFKPFPKIGRLRRDIVITEKIDGSNGCVVISEDGKIQAQKRTSFCTPGKTTDNMGFAAWVEKNADDLRALGPGYHYGEWWGAGIQRRYGLVEGDKRFSLFNVERWRDGRAPRPECCGVVPILYEGQFTDAAIDGALAALRMGGSRASPGYLFPEGIVVWHKAVGQFFKVLLEGDEISKTESLARVA